MNASPNCYKDPNNVRNWWVVRKLPGSNHYIYFDDTGAIEGGSEYRDRLSLLVSRLGEQGTEYFAFNNKPYYNDFEEETTTKPPSYGEVAPTVIKQLIQRTESLKSLSKGIVSYSTSSRSGYYLKHSLQGFPVPIRPSTTESPSASSSVKTPLTHPNEWLPTDFVTDPKEIDTTSLSYGHIFICQSFDNIDTSQIAKALDAADPYIYATNIVDSASRSLLSPLFIENRVPASTSTSSDGRIKSSSSITSLWQSTASTLSLSLTLPLKYKMNGVKNIIEVKIPNRFSEVFGIPVGSSQFSSNLEMNSIAFSDSNILESGTLCVGDFGYATTQPGTIVCIAQVPANILKFMRMCTNKFVVSVDGQEQVVTSHTTFNGPLLIDTSFVEGGGKPIPPSYTTQYYQALSSAGNLLPHTAYSHLPTDMLSVGCNRQCLNSFMEGLTQSTDKNGFITYSESRSQTIQVYLTSTMPGSVAVSVVGLDQSQKIIPFTQLKGALFPSQDTDNNIVLVYRTLQMLADIVDKRIIQEGSLLIDDLSFILSIAPNNIGLVNGLANTPINLASPCMEEVLRAFSNALIKSVSNNQLYDVSALLFPTPSTIHSESSSYFVAFYRGLVNAMSVTLGQLAFPNTLQHNHLLDSCTGLPVDIENYRNDREVSPTKGIYNEGWVTAYLYDLIDSNDDSDQSALPTTQQHRRALFDDNSDHPVPLYAIVESIQKVVQVSTQPSVLDFTNSLVSVLGSRKLVRELYSIDTIMQYNNIFYVCPVTPGPAPPLPSDRDPTLQEFFMSKLVGDADIHSLPLQQIETILSLWAQDDNTPIMKNQALQYLYSSAFKNMVGDPKLTNILKPFDASMCQFGSLDRPITPLGIQLLTKYLGMVRDIGVIAEQHLGGVLTVRTYKDISVVLFKDKICSFTVTNNIHQAVNQCPCTPMVKSITPLSGPLTRVTQLTITGRNLDNAYFKVAEVDCMSNSGSIDPGLETLICEFPTFAGTHTITYGREGGASLNWISVTTFSFTVDAPQINRITPNSNVPTNNAMVAIYGTNFFPPPLTGDVINRDGIQLFINHVEFPIETTDHVGSENIIYFKTNNVGTKNLVSIKIRGKESNMINIRMSTPTVSSINIFPLTSLRTNSENIQTPVTVTGTNFGLNEEEITAFVGPNECDSIEVITQNSFICNAPTGRGMGHRVKVQIGDQVALSSQTLNYAKPSIYQVIVNGTYPTGPTKFFWIVGTDFGTTQSDRTDIHVYFKHQDTKLKELHTKPADCKNALELCQDFPFIYYKSFSRKPQDGEEEVWVPSKDIEQANKNEPNLECLICYFGSAVGAGWEIESVEFDGRKSVFNQSAKTLGYLKELKYSLPVVDEVKAENGLPTNGGETFRLLSDEGVFPPNEMLNTEIDQDTGVPTPTQRFEIDSTYSNMTIGSFKVDFDHINWIDSKTIEATLPPGYGANLLIKLYVGKQYAESRKISYDPPRLLEGLFGGPEEGGNVIDILGYNFLPYQFVHQFQTPIPSMTVKINAKQCRSVLWVNHNRVLCEVPPGVGKQLHIDVVVGGQETRIVNDYYSYYRNEPEPPSIWTTIFITVTVTTTVSVTGGHRFLTYGGNAANYNGYQRIEQEDLNNGERRWIELTRFGFERHASDLLLTTLAADGPPEPGTIVLSFVIPPGGGRVGHRYVDGLFRSPLNTLVSYKSPVLTNVNFMQLGYLLRLQGSDLGLPQFRGDISIQVGTTKCALRSISTDAATATCYNFKTICTKNQPDLVVTITFKRQTSNFYTLPPNPSCSDDQVDNPRPSVPTLVIVAVIAVPLLIGAACIIFAPECLAFALTISGLTKGTSTAFTIIYGVFTVSQLTNVINVLTILTREEFIVNGPNVKVVVKSGTVVKTYYSGETIPALSDPFAVIEIYDLGLFSTVPLIPQEGVPIYLESIYYTVPQYYLDGMEMTCSNVEDITTTPSTVMTQCLVPPYVGGDLTKEVVVKLGGIAISETYSITYEGEPKPLPYVDYFKGRVYYDQNNNNIFNSVFDRPAEKIIIQIKQGSTVVAQTMTNMDGYYAFPSVDVTSMTPKPTLYVLPSQQQPEHHVTQPLSFIIPRNNLRVKATFSGTDIALLVELQDYGCQGTTTTPPSNNIAPNENVELQYGLYQYTYGTDGLIHPGMTFWPSFQSYCMMTLFENYFLIGYKHRYDYQFYFDINSNGKMDPSEIGLEYYMPRALIKAISNQPKLLKRDIVVDRATRKTWVDFAAHTDLYFYNDMPSEITNYTIALNGYGLSIPNPTVATRLTVNVPMFIEKTLVTMFGKSNGLVTDFSLSLPFGLFKTTYFDNMRPLFAFNQAVIKLDSDGDILVKVFKDLDGSLVGSYPTGSSSGIQEYTIPLVGHNIEVIDKSIFTKVQRVQGLLTIEITDRFNIFRNVRYIMDGDELECQRFVDAPTICHREIFGDEDVVIMTSISIILDGNHLSQPYFFTIMPSDPTS
ncbi:hypothetical protein DFA_06770 [Cavenderia fasciculata]|uniref:IPT/TIG domain-containing protein n=1 Tax=Cavenderia fasciculata TaxID=261658 RepID=F4Q283_CACFS|nr:uncharacterized protein DFA_06770 [Cavenderia fasciculata]EGG18103.1 hypothetical protein DFA_06770 [Cavenderia fasciculata]|eukprot:XP_004366144.1 hypothetical protein DFA_06770 [Cavenderia fasciculata]